MGLRIRKGSNTGMVNKKERQRGRRTPVTESKGCTVVIPQSDLYIIILIQLPACKANKSAYLVVETETNSFTLIH